MSSETNFTGMWVTKDGYIRHELLPGGRYDEVRGTGKALTGAVIPLQVTTSITKMTQALPPMANLSMAYCTMQVWCYLKRQNNFVTG